MGCIRPATPGFLVTLAATVLLAIVSFCVPWFKSVYFLKAKITQGGVTGSITFGTLGYCFELPNGTTCSEPSVGYQLDINSLVGNNTRFDIPDVVVQWVTYALVLHLVALAFAAGSAVFGLLAHVREMSMTCCSTCVSGVAAVVALLAFVFDLAFFFLAKARINDVDGGSAEMGNAIWLTLAAWLLLFFSGCFYTIGRCCISGRGGGRKPREDKEDWTPPPPAPAPVYNGGYPSAPASNYNNNYGGGDQMRMNAIKDEADRKERQQKLEGGLPSFSETQPLTARIEGNDVYFDGEPSKNSDALGATAVTSAAAVGAGAAAVSASNKRHPGYAPSPAGSRAVDEYYNPTYNAAGSYPPRRQGSGYSNGYPVSQNDYPAPPMPQSNQEYGSGQGPQRQYSSHDYYAPAAAGAAAGIAGAAAGREYGHAHGGTSYHSAVDHQQQPTGYSAYDPYAQTPSSPVYNSAGGFLAAPAASVRPSSGSLRTTGYSSHQDSYYTAQTPGSLNAQTPSGYGQNYVPPLSDEQRGASPPFPQATAVGTSSDPYGRVAAAVGSARANSMKGYGEQPVRTTSPDAYSDMPPGYEAPTSSSYFPVNEKR